MKADSGASKTYLQEKHCKYLLDQKCLEHGPETTLPDNSKIRASVQGTLPIHPELSHSALVYSTLHHKSLLPIGQICDEGYIAVLDKSVLSIVKKWKINPYRQTQLVRRIMGRTIPPKR